MSIEVMKNKRLFERKKEILHLLNKSDFGIKKNNLIINKKQLEDELIEVDNQIKNNVLFELKKFKEQENKVVKILEQKEIKKKINIEYSKLIVEYRDLTKKINFVVKKKKEFREIMDKLKNNLSQDELVKINEMI